MEHIVIIGNELLVLHSLDISEKIRFKITIVSAEHEFFFSRTALMYVFMGHMKFEHTQPYENDFGKK
jgi:hypothetical protein